MGRAVTFRRALGIVALSVGALSATHAAPVHVNLQLTSSAAVNAGTVPGHSYRFVYTGSVTGSHTGDFAHVLNIEPELAWWPASAVAWDSLFVTTPRGSFTLTLTSSRLVRAEPNDALPWIGSGTWKVVGGTGIFSGATGRGTLALNALAGAASTPPNTLTETVAGTITIDSAVPEIVLDKGSTRTPLRGPNGRLAVSVEIADPTPSSGLRLVEIRGQNAAVVQINDDRIAAAALAYRQELLEGTAVRRLTLLVESLTGLTAPEVQVSVADWAGNTATK